MTTLSPAIEVEDILLGASLQIILQLSTNRLIEFGEDT